MSEKELHTAEHIFARALQNLGIDLHVVKVDTESGALGSAIFAENIGIEILQKAEEEANKVIRQALTVSEQFFESIEEAKLRFPSLRLNEERLKGKEKLRLVQIGDYDFAMCKHPHASNTSQIIAFSLASVSHPEGKTKIGFFAGNDALDYMSKIAASALRLSVRHNFDSTSIEERYSALSENNEKLKSEIETLLFHELEIGTRVFYLKNFDISDIYESVRKYLSRNTKENICIIGDSQVMCLGGSSSSLNMKELGAILSKEGIFNGGAKEHSLNGKIADPERAKTLVSEFLSSGGGDANPAAYES
ncbi:MAG: hypothetical protein ACP5NE_00260 [Candidatus Micrarchaeia archaeon]